MGKHWALKGILRISLPESRVDRMLIDCWNDVWGQLHQHVVNADVINEDALPAEAYVTMANEVVRYMCFALAIGTNIYQTDTC